MLAIIFFRFCDTIFEKKLKSLTSSQRNVHFNTLVNPGRFDFSKKLD